MANADGRLVIMAMDLMGAGAQMGTVLGKVTAERLGCTYEEFQAMGADHCRKEMDDTRVLVFGEPDADPIQGQANG